MTTYATHQLAIIETPMEDLGDPESWKDLLEVQLNFQPGSQGLYWLEVENELGRRSGTTGKAPKDITLSSNHKTGPKTFVNLQGRRFKVRVFIITDNYNPWVLRDISLGWLLGEAN